MTLQELSQKALKVRHLYDALNLEKHGKKWGNQDLMQGFVGDVGDLAKIVMAKEGLRDMENVDAKLSHELADCLWSVLVLADRYNIDLDTSFVKTMEELEQRIKTERATN